MYLQIRLQSARHYIAVYVSRFSERSTLLLTHESHFDLGGGKKKVRPLYIYIYSLYQNDWSGLKVDYIYKPLQSFWYIWAVTGAFQFKKSAGLKFTCLSCMRFQTQYFRLLSVWLTLCINHNWWSVESEQMHWWRPMFVTGPIYSLREVNLELKESILRYQGQSCSHQPWTVLSLSGAYDAVYCDRRLGSRHGKLLPPSFWWWKQQMEICVLFGFYIAENDSL